jgi:cephalosporin-C deacetylase
VPALEVTVDHTTATMRAEIHDLMAGAVVDKTEATEPGKALRVEIPAGEEDRYLSVKVWPGDASEDAEPVVVWNTLSRAKSQPLLGYEGRPGELAPPEDFDEYWGRAKEELAAVPLEPVIHGVEHNGGEGCELYRVDLPTVRGTKVVAWYTVPKGALAGDKQYPAMIVMPGYGAEEPPLDRTASGIITLSLNPRHHGPSKEYWTSPVEHMNYRLEEPEEQYYKLAVLDCLRGAEFLFSRPEVDKKRVAAEGGSQGGYFAVALAALEPRLSCAVSNVTAFSDLPDGMILNKVGHAQGYREMLEQADPQKAARIRRSLGYIDGANLASRVRVPLQINMGGRDPVCHYVTGIVVYNRVPAGIEKEFHVVPSAQHEVPGPMREANGKWLARFWGLEKAPGLPGAVLKSGALRGVVK